jgi:hypothetical protein
MQKGQFLLLASLMTVASFLGGTFASITVIKNTKQVVETPTLYLVDNHHHQVGVVQFGKDGVLRIMRKGGPSQPKPNPAANKDE